MGISDYRQQGKKKKVFDGTQKPEEANEWRPGHNKVVAKW